MPRLKRDRLKLIQSYVRRDPATVPGGAPVEATVVEPHGASLHQQAAALGAILARDDCARKKRNLEAVGGGRTRRGA